MLALKLSTDDRRAFERFNVVGVPSLQGYILGLEGAWQLICVGSGGCGFFGSMKNRVKKIPKQARIVFEWPGVFDVPIQVQVRLVYRVKKRLEKHDVRYLGFEFEQESKSSIYPLIHYLQELAEMGEVEAFLR